jgi:hypothetical protein
VESLYKGFKPPTFNYHHMSNGWMIVAQGWVNDGEIKPLISELLDIFPRQLKENTVDKDDI